MARSDELGILGIVRTILKNALFLTDDYDATDYSLSNYDLYMTQAKLVFIFINHKVMINYAIECIVLNWQDYISSTSGFPASILRACRKTLH